MNPVTPAARWSPALHSRRPFMGQLPAGTPTTDLPPVVDPTTGEILAEGFAVLTVRVVKDGNPLAGVAVEVMFMNGDTKSGVTEGNGLVTLSYNRAQKGQALVRITPPEGVEDIGEGSVQTVDLKGYDASTQVGSPGIVQFVLVGVGDAPSPLIGLGVAGVLYGLALGAL